MIEGREVDWAPAHRHDSKSQYPWIRSRIIQGSLPAKELKGSVGKSSLKLSEQSSDRSAYSTSAEVKAGLYAVAEAQLEALQNDHRVV